MLHNNILRAFLRAYPASLTFIRVDGGAEILYLYRRCRTIFLADTTADARCVAFFHRNCALLL